MARFSITLIDDPSGSGQVMPEFDPPLRSLLERRTIHGSESLSHAEGLGIILAESLVRASEPVITTSPAGLIS